MTILDSVVNANLQPSLETRTMNAAAPRKTTRKTKKTTEQARTAKLMTVGTSTVLALTCEKDVTFYRLEEIGADRGRGFRLTKAQGAPGEAGEYEVLLDGQFSSCECKGFLRHNHCRHVESLTALQNAGKLTAAPTQPEPVEPEPAEEEQTVE